MDFTGIHFAVVRVMSQEPRTGSQANMTMNVCERYISTRKREVRACSMRKTYQAHEPCEDNERYNKDGDPRCKGEETPVEGENGELGDGDGCEVKDLAYKDVVQELDILF
jgi:hypothetical protein